MTDPRNISIEDYSYDLPEGKIAFYPLSERDASKLLIYRKGNITEDHYSNLPSHLPEHSFLVLNNTKVVEARVLFQKETGGVIEIFCLEPDEQYGDITRAFAQTKKVYWHCLVGGASKWKKGQVLQKRIATAQDEIILSAAYVEKRNDFFIIELSWVPAHLNFAEILHQAGGIPLPPYIKRKAETSDTENYQTVYAETEGSVAAPTAGLHFTPALFAGLKEKNIQFEYLTLHVGAGTFKPVKAASMEEHEMHAEWIDVKKELIEMIAGQENNVIAVGTTSLRTIESLYWLGLKTINNNSPSFLSQWEAYELKQEGITVKQALQALVSYLEKNKLARLIARTQILIAPGYDFKIVNGLITNFHQPKSTLLLLVAAFIGEDWRKVYDYALKNDFRFLSYGDGSLLWRGAGSSR